MAEQTRQIVAQMRVPAGDDIWCGSISVGVAERTYEMRDFNDLIKGADNAVYKAKSQGRNCVATCEQPLHSSAYDASR